MIESHDIVSTTAKKKIHHARFIQKYAISFIFLALVIISTFITGGVTIRFANIVNILVQTSPVILIAMGVTMVIISGGIDLSLGSLIALSAIVTAGVGRVGADGRGLPIIIPIIVGLLVSGLAGFVNGLLITKTKIPPFIATLGMLTGARGLALVITDLITDTGSISSLNPAFKFIGQGSILGLPTPIWILAIMFVLTHMILSATKMGRYTYAIGGNIRAAEISGIKTDRYLMMVYTYSGLMAGVAGIIIIGILDSAQPTIGVLYELEAIAASVIGGTSLSGGIGSIPGTLIGALFVGVLRNTMDLQFISAYWQDIARGIVIVVAVILDVRKQKLTLS